MTYYCFFYKDTAGINVFSRNSSSPTGLWWELAVGYKSASFNPAHLHHINPEHKERNLRRGLIFLLSERAWYSIDVCVCVFVECRPTPGMSRPW